MTDHESLRIDPAKARRHNGVAVLNIGIARDIDHLRHIRIVQRPCDNAVHTRIGSLNECSDGGTHIKDKLYFGRDRADLHNASHKTFARNDWHVLSNAVLCATVDHDCARPERRVTSDHTCSKEIKLMHRLLIREEFAQAHIFSGVLLCRSILLPQLFDLVFEHFILLMYRCDLPNIRRQ